MKRIAHETDNRHQWYLRYLDHRHTLPPPEPPAEPLDHEDRRFHPAGCMILIVAAAIIGNAALISLYCHLYPSP
jgi:hypothetical protein